MREELRSCRENEMREEMQMRVWILDRCVGFHRNHMALCCKFYAAAAKAGLSCFYDRGRNSFFVVGPTVKYWGPVW